jgi:hypothetical protein
MVAVVAVAVAVAVAAPTTATARPTTLTTATATVLPTSSTLTTAWAGLTRVPLTLVAAPTTTTMDQRLARLLPQRARLKAPVRRSPMERPTVYSTDTAEDVAARNAAAQAEANRQAMLAAQMEEDRKTRAASEAAAVEADRIAKEEAAARMEAEAEAAAAEQDRLRLEEAAASFEEEAAADDAQRVTLPPSGGGITDIPVEDLLPPPPAYEGPTEDGTAGYEQDTSRSVVDPVSGNIVAVFPTTPDSDLANRYIEGYQQGFRDEDLETFVDESYGISPPATDPYQLPELVLDAELPVDEFTGLPPSMTDPNYMRRSLRQRRLLLKA